MILIRTQQRISIKNVFLAIHSPLKVSTILRMLVESSQHFSSLPKDLNNSADYDLEYSSAAFNRLRVSISALNGAILKVVDLKLAERSSVKALVNLN